MIDFKLPEIGEGVTEATIVQWNFSAGDRFTEGDVLVEIMTDKVNVEVEAEMSGTLDAILAKADDEVRVGAVIARIQPESGGPHS
ncbi:MAG: hypothetical protein NXI27_17225 [Alphaproteobacteria bacterium]|nr:hypothetical protein [Alphaproteobacteria bacterium]